jgi:hypothetical protein
VTTMIDFQSAKILRHRQNIQRYARLLATELTELERQYLHKRIAEEQVELERPQESYSEQAAALIAADAMGNGSEEQSNVAKGSQMEDRDKRPASQSRRTAGILRPKPRNRRMVSTNLATGIGFDR